MKRYAVQIVPVEGSVELRPPVKQDRADPDWTLLGPPQVGPVASDGNRQMPTVIVTWVQEVAPPIN